MLGETGFVDFTRHVLLKYMDRVGCTYTELMKDRALTCLCQFTSYDSQYIIQVFCFEKL